MIKIIMDSIINKKTEVKVAHQLPGRIRFRIEALKYIPNHSLYLMDSFDDVLSVIPGIENVELNNSTGSILITFDPKLIDNTSMISYVSEIVRFLVKSREEIMQINEEDIPSVLQKAKKYIKENLSNDLKFDLNTELKNKSLNNIWKLD